MMSPGGSAQPASRFGAVSSIGAVALSTLIAGALMAFMYLYGNGVVGDLSRQIDQIVDGNLKGSIALSDISTSIQSVNARFNRLLVRVAIRRSVAPARGEIDAIGREVDEVIAKLEDYKARYATPEQQDRLAEVLGYLSDYRAAASWVANMVEVDFQSATGFIEPFGIVFDRAQGVMRAIVEQAERDAEARSRAASRRASEAVATFLFVAIGVAVGIAAVTWMIGRYQQRLRIDSEQLQKEVASRTRDLTEALARQSASVEILEAISNALADPKPVFDRILDAVIRLCDTPNASIWLIVGDEIVELARGLAGVAPYQPDDPMRIALEGSFGQFIARQTTPWHVADIRESPESGYAEGDPNAVASITMLGVRTTVWAPMLREGRALGFISIFRPQVAPFSPSQIDLLKAFAAQAIVAIENSRLLKALQDRTGELEALVETLRTTQAQLVQAEKMASLGTLVAGIAHEINTPLGIAVTATTQLARERDDLKAAITGGQLSRRKLDDYVDSARAGLDIAVANLTRAAGLVSSFKQVAVDQNSEEPRRIILAEYVGDVLRSLSPVIKAGGIEVEQTIPPDIVLTLQPGALAQVLTNLVQNAARHAFDGVAHPMIAITAARIAPGEVELVLSDNGRGMSDEVRARAFDPFFTTKRGDGGTGLGLHIVHNLVSEVLAGRLDLISAPARGTTFRLVLPA